MARGTQWSRAVWFKVTGKPSLGENGSGTNHTLRCGVPPPDISTVFQPPFKLWNHWWGQSPHDPVSSQDLTYDHYCLRGEAWNSWTFAKMFHFQTSTVPKREGIEERRKWWWWAGKQTPLFLRSVALGSGLWASTLHPIANISPEPWTRQAYCIFIFSAVDVTNWDWCVPWAQVLGAEI